MHSKFARDATKCFPGAASNYLWREMLLRDARFRMKAPSWKTIFVHR